LAHWLSQRLLLRLLDPLWSWNDGTAKQSIDEFVAKVTKVGRSDCVPPVERIAVFDNDGTLVAACGALGSAAQ